MSGHTPSPAIRTISRFILTGFMGAGKTTVGALLAERLGWTFIDSDRVIESRAGTSIAGIFSQQGEPAFRELEAAVIRETAAGSRLVLALGGGALETAATRAFLASLGETIIVYLEAPLDTLVHRCAAHDGGPVRPVLADRARLEERWRNRQPWYQQAHLIIPTAQLTPAAAVDRILNQSGALCSASSVTRAGAGE